MKLRKCKKCGWPCNNDIEGQNYFFCERCKYEAKILDISYKNEISASLSNLFPHEFEIDGVKCLSMESFIQSLRVREENIQRDICSKYSGYMAYKMRRALPDWRKTGKVYWKEREIVRNSEEYVDLITKAYDCLFKNEVFKFCLNSFKDYYLIHSIGCHDSKETLLTEDEYIAQLYRLTKKL